jgi:hypothetical protein
MNEGKEKRKKELKKNARWRKSRTREKLFMTEVSAKEANKNVYDQVD